MRPAASLGGSFLPSHATTFQSAGRCPSDTAAIDVALSCRCWCKQTGSWEAAIPCIKRSPTGVTEAEPLPSLHPLPPGDAECFLQTLSSWGRPCFLKLCRPRGLKNKLLSLSIVPDTIEIYLTLFYDEHTNIKALSSKK